MYNMKLNTRTTNLSSNQRRHIVKLVIDWMKINIGEKKSKERTFKYKVIKLGDEYTPAYGCYDPTINTLCVFHNFCPTVKWIIISVLHEYTHYLQNLRYYHDTLKKVGYEVDRKNITLDGDSIKTLGKYTAKAKLYKDVNATVHFEVVEE